MDVQHATLKNEDSHPVGYIVPVADLPAPDAVAPGIGAFDPATGLFYVCNGVDRWQAYLPVPSDTVRGDVLFFNGTTFARLPAGENGQVLTTHGTAQDPTWMTPVAGGVSDHGALTGLADDVRREVDAAKAGILELINVSAAIPQIIGAASDIVRTITSIPQDSADLFSQIVDMTNDVLNDFGEDISNASTPTDSANVAYILQGIGTACVLGVANAGIMIDYETRETVGKSIDDIDGAYSDYLAVLQSAGNVDGSQFAIDHDTLSGLHGAAYDTITYLTNASFDLKLKRTYTLTAPSDPVTLCWKYYRDISHDTLDFFARTNKLVNYEFIEIPAGREVAIYG